MLQESRPADPPAPARSRAAWIAIGAALVVVLWLPLLLIALPAATLACGDQSGAPAPDGQSPCLVAAWAGLALLIFVLAAAASGALLSHIAPAAARTDRALGGALGGLEIWVLAMLGGGLGPLGVAGLALLTLFALGAGGAWLGAALGKVDRGRPGG